MNIVGDERILHRHCLMFECVCFEYDNVTSDVIESLNEENRNMMMTMSFND